MSLSDDALRELAEELGSWANCLGVTGAPFDAWLTLRGLRTLHARLRVHEGNARALIDVATAHPAVLRVHHPSLPSTPGYDVALRQQQGWGSLLSLEVAGGRFGVDAFLSGLRHFILAESLGGVESLVAHPSTMTHASMDEDARREAGIHDGLLRLSVGIEAVEDLRSDSALRPRAGTGTGRGGGMCSSLTASTTSWREAPRCRGIRSPPVGRPLATFGLMPL